MKDARDWISCGENSPVCWQRTMPFSTGVIAKEDFISAGGALPGDTIAMIWDPDGKRSPNGPYWDTITFKTSYEVLQRRGVMNQLARDKLLHGSKDISDAGLFGTAFMMANYARVGMAFDLDALFPAFHVDSLGDLAWFSTAYITTGFLVALDNENLDAATRIVETNGIEIHAIGTVASGSQVAINEAGNVHVIFDWNETPIFP